MSFSGCGGIFQATSGEIHSPNYPEPYNNNTDCSWIIQVDHSHRIRLNFTDFDIEDHHSCNYDNVAVSNNRNFKHFLNESGEMLAKEEAYCAIESAGRMTVEAGGWTHPRPKLQAARGSSSSVGG